MKDVYKRYLHWMRPQVTKYTVDSNATQQHIQEICTANPFYTIMTQQLKFHNNKQQNKDRKCFINKIQFNNLTYSYNAQKEKKI